MYRDNLDGYDRIVTFDELALEAEEEYENMSESEKHFRLIHNEPTFIRYICSLMHSGKIEKAIINEYTYKFEKA